MLQAIRRLFQREAPSAEWPGIERWALQRGRSYRRPRDANGFVVEGAYEGRSWRLEWGPSQREYIEGRELRLRMELELPQQMQLLVLSRALTKRLENQTFERYTDNTKTQIDSSTPEEMRWLVMYPKLSLRALPRLHGRVVAVGSSLPAAAYWLDGALAEQLEQSLDQFLGDQCPFVLMCMRSRVMLRVQMPEPTIDALDQAVLLFQTAVEQTPNAVSGLGETSSPWPTTGASSLQDGPETR